MWVLLLLGRISMFTGWYDLIRGKVAPHNHEFVSADVRTFKDPGIGTYEMLSRQRDTGKSPEPTAVLSFAVSPLTPAAKGGRETPDYFGAEARYKSPSRSFSSPQAPPGIARDWDPSSTYAAPAPAYQAGIIDPLAMHKI
jgi:hypothetical protein